MSLNAKEIPLELRAQFWRKGKYIDCSADGISMGFGPTRGKIELKELSLAGGTLELNIENFTLGFGGGGSTISWPNRRERLWKAKDAWLKHKRDCEALT